VIQMFEGN